MPVKLRHSKRRCGLEAEAAAWAELFSVGYDFFGDLEPFGFPGGDADRKARAAAREAWRRFGTAFMANWKPTDTRDQPWAFSEFGAPPCR
jgi:hypothetical protein